MSGWKWVSDMAVMEGKARTVNRGQIPDVNLGFI